MKYINVYLDSRGLWSAALCLGNKRLESTVGAYPKSNSMVIDARGVWGKDLRLITSYGPLFISEHLREKVIALLREGIDGDVIAAKFNISLLSVSEIKEGVDIDDKPTLCY